MRLRTPLVIAATAAAMLGTSALPAMAADTTTTFSLTGGSLALSVQPTAALGNTTTGDTSVTGSLGAVSVTDLRGGTAEWNVSAGSTTFTESGGTTSTAVSYVGGVVTETGSITVADGSATTMSTDPASVVAPSVLSGNNTAAWNPTLDVTLPASALVGAYSGTVTTSVA